MTIDNIRLQASSEEISGVPVLKIVGEIDVYTAPEFKSVLGQMIDTGVDHLVLDMSGVSYMDSSGFGALLSAMKKVFPNGGSIALAGCSPAIERMLQITMLDTIFNLHATIDAAVSSMK